MLKSFFLVLVVLPLLTAVDGFFVLTMKRGRGLAKEFGGKSKKGPMSTGAPSSNTGGWATVAGLSSVRDLPTQEGKIQIVDTLVKKLIDGATNPTGAVCVVKHKAGTYCFSASCPSCKIPLNKAKVLEPSDETGSDPRLSCDFCSATFNLRTGERVASVGGSGIFSGVVKGLFSKQENVPLDVYALGEKDGKVVINLS